MAILAAVDDLLFSSKIRATAKQVGADVQFARTPEDILEQARRNAMHEIDRLLRSLGAEEVRFLAS